MSTTHAVGRDPGLERLEAFVAAVTEAQANLQRARAAVETGEEEIEDTGSDVAETMAAIGHDAGELAERTLAGLLADRKEIIHAFVWGPFILMPVGTSFVPLGEAYPALAEALEQSLNAQAELAFMAYEALPAAAEEAGETLEAAEREAGLAFESFEQSVADDLAESHKREAEVEPPSLEAALDTFGECASAMGAEAAQQGQDWGEGLRDLGQDLADASEAFANDVAAETAAFLEEHEGIVCGFLNGSEELGAHLAARARVLGLDVVERVAAGVGLGHVGGSAGFSLEGHAGPLEFNLEAHVSASAALRPIEDLMGPLTIAADVVGTIRELLDAFTPF